MSLEEAALSLTTSGASVTIGDVFTITGTVTGVTAAGAVAAASTDSAVVEGFFVTRLSDGGSFNLVSGGAVTTIGAANSLEVSDLNLRLTIDDSLFSPGLYTFSAHVLVNGGLRIRSSVDVTVQAASGGSSGASPGPSGDTTPAPSASMSPSTTALSAAPASTTPAASSQAAAPSISAAPTTPASGGVVAESPSNNPSKDGSLQPLVVAGAAFGGLCVLLLGVVLSVRVFKSMRSKNTAAKQARATRVKEMMRRRLRGDVVDMGVVYDQAEGQQPEHRRNPVVVVQKQVDDKGCASRLLDCNPAPTPIPVVVPNSQADQSPVTLGEGLPTDRPPARVSRGSRKERARRYARRSAPAQK